MRFGRGRDPAALSAAMVESQIRRRGVRDATVLSAMAAVPRDRFVPGALASHAYADRALPIGHGSTISQPYIVASMTEALRVDHPDLRVLEIGTGSGYQAAVLAECGCVVYSVERVARLHDRARRTLLDTGYAERIHLRLGDGYEGWPEEAPFDRVIVTAAAPRIPEALIEQLADGGVIVAPVGDVGTQVIRRCEKLGDELRCRTLEGVRFIPLLPGSE